MSTDQQLLKEAVAEGEEFSLFQLPSRGNNCLFT